MLLAIVTLFQTAQLQCIDAQDMIQRVKMHENLPELIKKEIITEIKKVTVGDCKFKSSI